MRNLKFLFLFLCQLSIMRLAEASEVKISPTFNLRSSEAFFFRSKKEIEFSDMGKISEFIGTIVKQPEASNDLDRSDFYIFPKEKKISITQDLCKSYMTKIFGDSTTRKNPVQKKLNLFKTNTGKACKIELEDSIAKKPIKIAILGFVHGKLIAQVWTLTKSPTQEETNEIEKLFKSFR